MYTVYIHENKINGKQYVGITSCSVNIRWKNGHGYSDKLPIGRAIRKYGWDGFDHRIIQENLSESEAKELEIRLISDLKTQNPEFGYNICAGGNGVTGWHPIEDTRKKISESARLRVGEKNANFGHKWTKEMKKCAGEKKRRENLSDDTLRRMSEAAKERNEKYGNPFSGKKHSEETKRKISDIRSRPVKMFDNDGMLIKEFPSLKKASELTGINKVAISNCCRGLAKTSGGYIWKYSDKCDL